MNAEECAAWMERKVVDEGCLYQDDVVDLLTKNGSEAILRENAQGNLVLGTKLLNEFLKRTSANVVWVKGEFYWRLRVDEDEPGREARG